MRARSPALVHGQPVDMKRRRWRRGNLQAKHHAACTLNSHPAVLGVHSSARHAHKHQQEHLHARTLSTLSTLQRSKSEAATHVGETVLQPATVLANARSGLKSAPPACTMVLPDSRATGTSAASASGAQGAHRSGRAILRRL